MFKSLVAVLTHVEGRLSTYNLLHTSSSFAGMYVVVILLLPIANAPVIVPPLLSSLPVIPVVINAFVADV